ARTDLIRQLNHECTANYKDSHNNGSVSGSSIGTPTMNAAEASDTRHYKDSHDNGSESSGSGATRSANQQKTTGFATDVPAAVHEHIDLPLAQARTGYIVAAPGPQDPAVDAWRAALYILSHEYEGRLGKEAISRRGLVYYIDSGYRSDGTTGWITLSAGVDPRKQADMRELLEDELHRLIAEPPSDAEIVEALQHRMGRALSAQQSNRELADSLARQWLWQEQLESPAGLRSRLSQLSRDDILRALQDFVSGTIVDVTVRPPGNQTP
ncbi:MAG: insulinase family protein, partial [Halioglobus sp.]|nr:insulinase family protein [Halioglobus sp.]